MRFGFVATATLALLWFTPVTATPVVFNYDAPGCDDCSGLGLASGSKVTFQITFDSADLLPNKTLHETDVKAFKVSIGSFVVDSTTDKGLHFAGMLNATADAFQGLWYLFASNAIAPNVGDTASVARYGWSAGSGNCANDVCAGGYVNNLSGAYFSTFDPSHYGILSAIIPPPTSPSVADIFHGAVQVSAGPAWLPFRAEYDLDERYTQDWKDLIGDGFLSTGIGAAFVPGGDISLADAAQRLGYDHFNWVQLVSDPANPSAGWTLDPPLNCYDALTYVGSPCPNRDNLPWYLDEQYTVDGKPVYNSSGVRVAADDSAETRRELWTDSPDTLLFNDAPNVPRDFVTCLVGVRPDGGGDILNITEAGVSDTCFIWNSEGTHPIVSGEFEGLGGGTGLNLFYNGFLNDSYFDDSVDKKLSDLGIGLRTIDATAPEPLTLSVFAAGLLGLGFARRRMILAIDGEL